MTLLAAGVQITSSIGFESVAFLPGGSPGLYCEAPGIGPEPDDHGGYGQGMQRGRETGSPVHAPYRYAGATAGLHMEIKKRLILLAGKIARIRMRACRQ